MTARRGGTPAALQSAAWNAYDVAAGAVAVPDPFEEADDLAGVGISRCERFGFTPAQNVEFWQRIATVAAAEVRAATARIPS